MKTELENSQTFKNLQTAFSGESEARNKYTYYASKARKDGYQQIADLFLETAEQEKEHAKIWFKLLHEGSIRNTTENLQDAAVAEHYEWTDMYKAFEATAREEGFTEIADLFAGVAEIEATHEKKYLKLLNNIRGDLVFSRDNDVIWQCSNCGHIHIGKKAPYVCPVCSHPQDYFRIMAENY